MKKKLLFVHRVRFAALLGIGGGSATPERSAAFWKKGTPERRDAFWEALVAEMPVTLLFTQRVLSPPIAKATETSDTVF